MPKIELTQGKFAVVDLDDYAALSKFNWFAKKNGHAWYAARMPSRADGQRKHILMHRVILKMRGDAHVDHKNNDGLDNRKANLRKCTGAENQRNKRYPDRGLPRGVCRLRGGFQAQISVDGRLKYLGVFRVVADAARAYDEASLKYHGEFGVRNV